MINSTSNINQYKLQHILELEEQLIKLKGDEEIKIVSNHLLRICRNGDFTTEDIKKLKKEKVKTILSKLVTYFFALEMTKEEAKKAGRMILYTDVENNSVLVNIDLNNIKQEFNYSTTFDRAYLFYNQLCQKQRAGFTIFRNFEKRRWKFVIQYFDVLEKEHILISLYLSKISTLTKGNVITTNTQKFSFGIDIKNEKILQELFIQLTDKINFIHIPVMNKFNKKHSEKYTGVKEAASLLVASDYNQFDSVIYFGSPTTIVCYILDLINKKMGNGKNLQGYSIERSKKIKISPSKLKSDQQLLKDFELLTRDNYAQTLSRVKKYLRDPNTIESRQFRKIKPILKEHLLL